jgi:Bacterial PH domain
MAWFGIFRLTTIRVCVDSEGVEVFNPFRRVFVPWGRISAFSLRHRRVIFGPLGHIDLKDGSSVVMFAIAGQNPALRPSERSAQRMIEELNQLLVQAQTRELFHEQ